MTDKMESFIPESSVYRILIAYGLITSPVFTVVSAKEKFEHPTTRTNELWQNEGLVWGNFEWMATFTLILLGLVFAPFYFKSRISTLPEFLEKRYGPGSRMILPFFRPDPAMPGTN